MTDKEIIEIDGVDVSRCKYLPYCNDKQGNCAFEPNCYYKQLKRKTQELELAERLINGILKTLNLEAYDWRADQNEILAEIRGFKKEYEELKKELRELKLKHTTLQNRYQQLDGATRYRNAIEEIEKIVNVDFSLPCARTACTYPEPCKDSLTENGTKCMRFALLKIKDIVNKAKDGNNE